jgi:hypothetical protein
LYNECKNRFLHKWHWHCFLLDQSDDRFHLLLCTCKQWHPRFERAVSDWKTWVTTVRLHYVNCSGDSRVEGVHRYLRQSGFMRILSVCHSKTLVAYFRAKFQVCRGALTSRVKQLWQIMSRRKDKSIC